MRISVEKNPLLEFGVYYLAVSQGKKKKKD